MIYKREEKENAVSPVIGVMLMLVITIVIAGVVSVIAGGMTEGVNESPTAVIKLDDYTLAYVPYQGYDYSNQLLPDSRKTDEMSGQSHKIQILSPDI